MKLLLILFFLFSANVFADDEDSKTTTIQSIDLTGGDGPTAPNYSLLILDLQKLKAPSANGHLIFRQLRNRVRLEVTGNSFPKGKYSVGVSNGCSPNKSAWTHWHEVIVDSAYVASEKSLPKFALRKASRGETLLEGKNAGLFRHQGKNAVLIDCKPIK